MLSMVLLKCTGDTCTDTPQGDPHLHSDLLSALEAQIEALSAKNSGLLNFEAYDHV